MVRIRGGPRSKTVFCEVAGCDRKHHSKGMCERHYRRLLHHGHPEKLTLEQIYPVTKEWLFANIEQVKGSLETECWEWQLCKGESGYGIISRKWSGSERAHRASHELFLGPIPNGLHVLHKCDNRPCINPDHLFLGTNDDNVRDCVSKGRQARGETNYSKLTEEKVMQIRYFNEIESLTYTEIARKYSVSINTVKFICEGKRWKHLFNRPVWSTPSIVEVEV